MVITGPSILGSKATSPMDIPIARLLLALVPVVTLPRLPMALRDQGSKEALPGGLPSAVREIPGLTNLCRRRATRRGRRAPTPTTTKPGMEHHRLHPITSTGPPVMEEPPNTGELRGTTLTIANRSRGPDEKRAGDRISGVVRRPTEPRGAPWRKTTRQHQNTGSSLPPFRTMAGESTSLPEINQGGNPGLTRYPSFDSHTTLCSGLRATEKLFLWLRSPLVSFVNNQQLIRSECRNFEDTTRLLKATGRESKQANPAQERVGAREDGSGSIHSAVSHPGHSSAGTKPPSPW